MVLVSLKQSHVCGLLRWPLVRQLRTDTLQQTPARRKRLLVNHEALPFPLEHLCLHLLLKISPERSFPIVLIVNTFQIVVEVVNQTDRGKVITAWTGNVWCIGVVLAALTGFRIDGKCLLHLVNLERMLIDSISL